MWHKHPRKGTTVTATRCSTSLRSQHSRSMQTYVQSAISGAHLPLASCPRAWSQVIVLEAKSVQDACLLPYAHTL